MSLTHQMNEWSSKHHPKWLVVLRVALGLCLLIKGFEFIQNSVLLPGLLSQVSFIHSAPWLNTLIPWVHILGGSMLLVGLFTRLSCIAQIPILFGAVFFVNANQGLYGSDLLFSVIILLLLVFFLVEGGGPLSMDNYFHNYNRINKE